MVHSDKNNKRTKRFICKFLVFFALLVKKGNVNCTEAPKEAYSCKCTAVFKNTINFFKDF